jgi:uncharacterized phage protein gp47/JayE
MAFSRPALPDLIARAVNDMLARLPGSDATLRRSNLNVLARMHAGVTHGLYGFIDWASRQIIYDTAEIEYLERWSTIWGVQRLPAAFATGLVTLTGSNGAVIPAGTELQRADGVLYVTDADATITLGSATVPVMAGAAGADGNADSGAGLILTTPVAAVDSAAITGALSGGADAETPAALLSRLLRRIQQPPHGGAKHDYEAWALQVPGVTRVWVSPGELGAGTVVVRFVRDYDDSMIPDAGEVATVQAYIDVRRPVTAQVTVAAPAAVPLDFTIAVTPNTQAVKDAVEAELADLISREAVPGGTLYLSHIQATISGAAGETNYTLTAPSADVVSAAGQITTMGAITWV